MLFKLTLSLLNWIFWVLLWFLNNRCCGIRELNFIQAKYFVLLSIFMGFSFSSYIIFIIRNSFFINIPHITQLLPCFNFLMIEILLISCITRWITWENYSKLISCHQYSLIVIKIRITITYSALILNYKIESL